MPCHCQMLKHHEPVAVTMHHYWRSLTTVNWQHNHHHELLTRRSIFSHQRHPTTINHCLCAAAFQTFWVSTTVASPVCHQEILHTLDTNQLGDHSPPARTNHHCHDPHLPPSPILLNHESAILLNTQPSNSHTVNILGVSLCVLQILVSSEPTILSIWLVYYY